jgi:signal transduction histidine kinase
MAPFVIYFNGKFNRATHIIFALCMGAIRGATINLTAPVLRVEDPQNLVLRTLNSSLSVLYAFIVAGIVISVWTKFDSDLRQLLSNAIEDGRLRSNLDQSTLSNEKPETSGSIQQVLAELNDYIASTTNEKGSLLTLKEQANAIDRLINKHIRPHSAARWRQAELIWPKIRPWDVLRKSISSVELPVVLTLLFTLPLSLFGQFSRSSFLTGVITQVVSILFTLIAWKSADQVRKNSKNKVRAGNIVFVLLMLVVNLPILVLLSYLINFQEYSSLTHLIEVHVASMLTFIMILFIASIVKIVQENRENALALLEEVVSKQALQSMIDGGVVASTQSEFAQYLHAEVQSQLMACKLLLLKAAESNFTLMSPEVTQKVLDRLELLKQPYEKRPDRIPSDRLQEFRSTWEGLAQIFFNLPPELSKVSRSGDVIAQLIEELIVNAIRHGKAKNITVNANIADGFCMISVLDDGRIKSTKKAGLGSTLFEVFAPDWKLVSTSQGTLATLTAKYF